MTVVGLYCVDWVCDCVGVYCVGVGGCVVCVL